jgi:hypothetical protein
MRLDSGIAMRKSVFEAAQPPKPKPPRNMRVALPTTRPSGPAS